MADSSTGGYLTPTATTDTDLGEFLHDLLEGLTGIDTNLIRVNWQKDPPPSPENGVNWIGYGITVKAPEDGSAYLEPTDGAESEQQRHEDIDLALQVYGDNCLLTASQIESGLEIGQNREALYLNKMAYVGTSEISHVPELINGEWFNRADMTLTFRRQVNRTFSILSLVDASATIEPDPESLGHIQIDSVIS
ncbi:MAG: hypothetical protein KAS30_01545 [Candidatus Diapherotrites archaeon]|nr:hypothetical protein [Candidatus Diapherotrites archaeon]